MNRSALLASLLLASVPIVAHAAGTPPARSHVAKRAQKIVTRMMSALHHATRGQAMGWASGKAQPRTQYQLRYQATGKEEYQASVATSAKKGQTSPSASLHYILMGKTVYTRVATRWYKVRGSTTPDAVDALSLDSNGAYCCTATGIRPEVLLKFR